MPIDPNAFSADEEKTIQPDPLASFRKKRPQLADLASFSGGGTSADDLSKAPLNAGEVSGPLGIPQSSEAGAPSLLATERVQRSPIATSEQATPLLSNPFERGQAIGSEAQRGEVGITGGVRGTPQMSTANRNEALMSFFRPQAKQPSGQPGQAGQPEPGQPSDLNRAFQTGKAALKIGQAGSKLKDLMASGGAAGTQDSTLPGGGQIDLSGRINPEYMNRLFGSGAQTETGAHSLGGLQNLFGSGAPDFGADSGLMNLSGQINPEYMNRLFGGAGQGIGGGTPGGMTAPTAEGDMYSTGASGAGGAGYAGLGAAAIPAIMAGLQAAGIHVPQGATAGAGFGSAALSGLASSYGAGGLGAAGAGGLGAASAASGVGAAGAGVGGTTAGLGAAGAGAGVGAGAGGAGGAATAGTTAGIEAGTTAGTEAAASLGSTLLGVGGPIIAAAISGILHELNSGGSFKEHRSEAGYGLETLPGIVNLIQTAKSPADIDRAINLYNTQFKGGNPRSQLSDTGLTGGYEQGEKTAATLNPQLSQLIALQRKLFAAGDNPEAQALLAQIQGSGQRGLEGLSQQAYKGVSTFPVFEEQIQSAGEAAYKQALAETNNPIAALDAKKNAVAQAAASAYSPG